MVAAMPKMVWMEIDLRNKELPVRIADSAEELARLCGTSAANVRNHASKAKYGRSRRRYIKVWIGDEDI